MDGLIRVGAESIRIFLANTVALDSPATSSGLSLSPPPIATILESEGIPKDFRSFTLAIVFQVERRAAGVVRVSPANVSPMK